MLDITTIKKITFEVKTFNGVLHLRQPKLKVIRRLMNIIGNSNKGTINPDDVNEITDLFRKILNNNTENRKISDDDINEKYDIGDMILILSELFKWINEVENSKNS